MKVSHRVYNSHGNLVGFLMDKTLSNTFINTGTAVKFIDSIDNLSLCDTGEFQYNGNKLVNITLKQYNESQYKVICKNNPIARDIQSDFEYWRTHESVKILQVQGSPGVGKTSELLKFAYKHYEQIISLYVLGLRTEFIESLMSGNITLECLNDYLQNHSDMPTYIDDKSTILIINVQIKKYINIEKLRNLLNCDIAVISNETLGNSDKINKVVLNTLQFKEFYRLTNGKNLHDLEETYKKIGGYPWIVMKYLEELKSEDCLAELRQLIDDIIELVLNQQINVKLSQIVKNTFKYIIKTIENDEYLRIFDIDADCREVISILSYYNILNLKGSNTDEYKVYFTDCGVLNYILRNSNYSKADTYRIIQKAFKQN